MNTLSTIANDLIEVGVDLATGGTICHLVGPGHDGNLINVHDMGRQVQQSYYAGPVPYGTSHHPAWPNWPWNPIGTGDAYGNTSTVLEHRNNGSSLYIKSIPMQWALNNVAAECTFESYISVEGPCVRIDGRLTNARADRTQYPAMGQELPAVYTIGKLHRLFTYDALYPFTGDGLRLVSNSGPPNPWQRWKARENWAALVDDSGYGVGVYHPTVHNFIGGFAGQENIGGPADGSTGYIAPLLLEILDHDIVYAYTSHLIVGSVAGIRDWVYEHRPDDSYVNVEFRAGRSHWYYADAVDDGLGLGFLRIRPTGPKPRMLGPQTWFRAGDIVITARYDGPPTEARLWWTTPVDDGWRPERSASVAVTTSEGFRQWRFRLGEIGVVTALRLDPVEPGWSGSHIDVASIQRE